MTYVNEGEIIMKNVKRILALTVSAALAVSCFAGCGNGAKKNSDTIVIGCSGPLTGDAAQSSHTFSRTMRLTQAIRL